MSRLKYQNKLKNEEITKAICVVKSTNLYILNRTVSTSLVTRKGWKGNRKVVDERKELITC